MRKNILPRKLAKPIEQLSDGTWIIRYAIQSIDRTDNEGNELVTYASSIFLEKPTLEMIKKSIHRYAMSVLDDEDVLPLVANPDLSFPTLVFQGIWNWHMSPVRFLRYRFCQ